MSDIFEGPPQYPYVVLNDGLMYIVSAYYLLAMYISTVCFNVYTSVEYIRVVQCCSDYQLDPFNDITCMLLRATIQFMCMTISGYDYD